MRWSAGSSRAGGSQAHERSCARSTDGSRLTWTLNREHATATATRRPSAAHRRDRMRRLSRIALAKSKERGRSEPMRRVLQCLIIGGATVVLARSGIANVFVYPQKGQSQEQQKRDSAECYNWAKTQSGVDPGQPPAQAQAGQHAGGTVRGAARGAAAGAAVGAIAGDAGKGAGAGAVVGGVRGRRQSKAAQQQQQATTRNAYDRAFAACMEGRGYTVRDRKSVV